MAVPLPIWARRLTPVSRNLSRTTRYCVAMLWSPLEPYSRDWGPDVIDLRSKLWWDVTSTAEEFAKKPPKYGTQYGGGTSLLYGEP